MKNDSTLLLEGLYLYLVRRGFPLSVRDFQDALTALHNGYGLHRRDNLLWLCETLWARNEFEISLLHRLFGDFAYPTLEDISEFLGESSRDRQSSHPKEGRSNKTNKKQEKSEGIAKIPTIEFVAPTQSGIGLPRAQVVQESEAEFIYNPRPLINLRSLIIVWRRYRIAQRSGPPIEIDINETIAKQCRQGPLIEPVRLPARRNQARLALLVDASPSMATWQSTNRLFRESLEFSQLSHAAVFFFDNSPNDGLYTNDSLSRPLDILDTLNDNSECALLVVSDAGAARGRLNRERLSETKNFIKKIKSEWNPIAWVNPMPRKRWLGNTAERIEQLSNVAMFELTESGMIQAIDYLRGKHVN